MINLLKNQKGDLTIELLISIPIILVLLIVAINFFSVMNIQLKLDNLTRQAIRIVEIEGGLTQSEINNINSQLSEMGLDVSKASIEGSYYPVQLRNPVYITIKYTASFTVPFFNIEVGGINLGAKMKGSSEKFFK